MARDYPPAVLVHRPDCADVAGRGLIPQPTRALAREHPNGRQHRCFHFHQNSVGVAEPVEYPAHEYRPGAVTQPDATRAGCSYCGSTHGVLDALILPAGARVAPVPPTQA